MDEGNFSNLKQSSLNKERRSVYVKELFDGLAPDYDRFNRWVTFSRDEAWRSETVRLLQNCASGIILDLAAGTGDLANCAARFGAKQVHVLDISFEMLTLAKKKLRASRNHDTRILCQQGSANLLPFHDNSMDGLVSGFAMRNVFHFLDEVLAEMYRVLKPAGRFAILELSQPRNPFLRMGFEFHLKTIMPIIGKLTTGQSSPFKYLSETTLTFLSPQQFKHKLENTGFQEVGYKKYLFGGIAIHYGTK